MIAAFIFMSGNTFAQTVKGVIQDQETGEELVGATVSIEGTSYGAVTNLNGTFTLKVEAGEQTLLFRFVGYESRQQVVTLKEGQTLNLGVITMKPSAFGLKGINIVADRAKTRETPVAFSNLKAEEIEQQLGSRDIPLVMNTTPSVYSTPQGGGAGDARLNIRGFDQRNVAIMINGVPVNDMENGWVYWSNWDGVGDATQSIQVQRGLSAVNLATPSIGGTMNIITNPAEMKQGVKVKQEFGSGRFIKSSVFAHTGLVDGKYAVSAGLVRKVGEGVIDGTWTDAWAYYFGASYNINSKNRLELYALGAPQRHGQNLYKQNIGVYSQDFADDLDTYEEAAEEAYPESTSGRLYNENWSPVSDTYQGRQIWNGLKRDRYASNFINERENYYHKPQVNLNWYTQWNEKMSQYTVLYYSGGQGGGTGTYGSVVWDYASEPTRIVDYNATIANNMVSDTAHGILRNSVNNQWTIGAISKLTYKVNDQLTTQFGIDWRTAEIEHYREVRDLLGGQFYYYTGNEFSNNPNKVLGDHIAYDNTNTVDWGGLFAQAEYKKDALSAYAMAGFSGVKYSYFDNFTKAANSNDHLYTETDWITGYQIKGGVNYNITEELNAFANLGYVSKVPIFDGAINDFDGTLVGAPENEKFMAAEAGIQFKTLDNMLDVKLNGYYTMWKDRTVTRGVTDAQGGDDVVVLSGIDALHMGGEFEAAFRPVNFFSLDVMASVGDWKYTDDATGSYIDYIEQPDGTFERVDTPYGYYIKDLKVGDAPQTQMAVGATVKPIKELRVQGVLRYYAKHYSAWDPTSRTDPNDRTQSWEAPDYSVLDFHASYALPIKMKGVKVSAFAHVFNALNTLYIQDAVDNSRYNGFDGDHDADDAEVFMGLHRTVNFGFTVDM